MKPTSVSKTFDTSLIDVQQSFSSTETNTSGSSTQYNNNMASTSGNPPQQDELSISAADKVLSNEELYDQWATTYDTDGNVLVAVDDIQMQDLLPALGRLVDERSQSTGKKSDRLKILDLGCGTGRVTAKLLGQPWTAGATIEAWDLSQGMLDVAKATCDAQQQQQVAGAEGKLPSVSFSRINFADMTNVPQHVLGGFDAVVSNLVLEHFPSKHYFAVLAALLAPGGFAIVTNMHDGMGNMTRAGYKTATGERVKGTSFVHTVESTIRAANEAGLEVIRSAIGPNGPPNGVRVVAPEEGMLGPRGKKWIGVDIWFGMVFRRP